MTSPATRSHMNPTRFGLASSPAAAPSSRAPTARVAVFASRSGWIPISCVNARGATSW
jgi:hypothetical protein